MNDDQVLQDLSSYVGTLYDLCVPLIIIFALVFLLTVSRSDDRIDPVRVAWAVFSYLMMSVSVVLMSFAAVVTGLAALSPGTLSTTETHVSLLLLFAAGGILFLWVDQTTRTMDPAAKRIPGIVYQFTLKIATYVTIVFSLLYIMIGAAYGTLGGGQWKLPALILAYGCLVAWLIVTAERQTIAPSQKLITKKQVVTRKPKPKAKKPARTGKRTRARS